MPTNPTYQLLETPWVRTKVLTRVKEGTLVTTLQAGESIAYSIQPKTGTTYGTAVGSGSSAVEVVHWTASPGTWAAIAKKTAGTALDVGVYRIRWTLTIGGGVAVEDDYLTIKA